MMTPEKMSETTKEICGLAPVIPVLVINEVAHAKPLGQALISGGLPVLEVTLRTPNALEIIREMSELEGGVVGAGTLLTPHDVERACEAGAKFGVSPGATETLLSACEEADLPLLPGAATSSEVMHLYERGYSVQKFFPAEANGGVAALKAIGSPLHQVSFCPTGGISPQNAQDYLALSNTLCVGGSWVAPQDMLERKDWHSITELAQAASILSA